MKYLSSEIALPYAQRFQLFLEQVKKHQEIWVLHDDDGAVMLVADDEDCIPIWPSKEAAMLWQNSEWESCQAMPVSVNDWRKKWTQGMLSDDLFVVVYPVPGEQAETLFPDEFEHYL